jgi:chemotaxis protein histidine kinase CheA
MENEPFRPSFLKNRKAAKPKDAFIFRAAAKDAKREPEPEPEPTEPEDDVLQGNLDKADEDDEADVEDVKTKIPVGPFRVNIVDDSRTAVLDRRLILERIHPAFLVRTNIESVSPIPILSDMKFAEPVRHKTDDADADAEPPMIVKTVDEVAESNRDILDKEPGPEPPEAAAKNPTQKRKYKKRGKIVLDDDNDGEAAKTATAAAPQIEKGPDLTQIVLNQKTLYDRLPKTPPIRVKISPYYMNNRRQFVQKIAKTFQPYSAQILAKANEITCANRDQNVDFDLLTHQLVVREYLNLYTPYRGLLLYHGLGSGKTCTSIAIAEGMKSQKRVYIMTPASLKMNFFSELKKCADHLYRKNQFWEFVSTDGQPELVAALSKALQLPRSYIESHRGAWFVDVKKAPNFGDLSETDQKNIDAQLNEMIRVKYVDINYNGLNMSKLNELTKNNTVNPFDHSVVIIDEAHNFVSRVVNKIGRPKSISSVLYHHLMNAVDAKVVFLTGTPIINYPNEIGVLFNMLRGYIKTWEIPVNITTKERVNRDTVLDIFKKEGIHMYDYVEYSGNRLTITRNPYGFVNTYKGDVKGKVRGGAGAKNNKTKSKSMSKTQATKSHKTTKKHKHKIHIDTAAKGPKSLFEIKDGILVKNPQFDANYVLEADEKIEYFEKHEGNNLYDGGGMGDTDETFQSYRGVQYDEDNRIDDVQFIERVKRVLPKYGIVPQGNPEPTMHKCLPDVKDRFIDAFIDGDTGNVKEMDLFKRRVLGLTSYFRSAQEQLLPEFVKTAKGETYHTVVCEMSDFQFGVYEKIRKQERDQEKQMKKNKKKVQDVGELYEIASTYRIFSRACCNFAFPDEQPRPLPDRIMDAKTSEDDYNALTHEERKKTDEYIDDAELADDPADEVSLIPKEAKTLVKVPGATAVKKAEMAEAKRQAAEAKAEGKRQAAEAKKREAEAKATKKAEAAEAKRQAAEAKAAKKAEEAEAKAAKKAEADEAKRAKQEAKEAKAAAKKTKTVGGSDEDDKISGIDDDDDADEDDDDDADEDEDDDKISEIGDADDEDQDEPAGAASGGGKTKPKNNLYDLDQDADNDESVSDDDDEEGADSELSNEQILDYQKRIRDALDFLKYDPLKPRPTEYLTAEALQTYSPKFKKILENLTDTSNSGIHLVYSNFRTIEGVGLLKLILEAAGMEEFKLTRSADNTWDIPVGLSENKPRFVLYTGTETAEEKEIIRNIYNSTWHLLPPTMTAKLRAISENNFMGAVIKIMMITSSGAEGINLRNTRFVHIVEPYWNMVRLEQVIGRARRICSHEDLPPNMRNVKVFCYISSLTEEQKTNEKNIELRISDVSRLTQTPITTDEYLFEIANIKNNINQQILRGVKETAIDCSLYSAGSDEKLACYFGNLDIKTNMFLSYPTLDLDKTEKIEVNVKTVKQRATKITVGKTDYAWNQATNEVYLYDNYKAHKEGTEELRVYGKLDMKSKKIVRV